MLRDHDGGDAGLGERLDRVGDQRPARQLAPSPWPRRAASRRRRQERRPRGGGVGEVPTRRESRSRRYARGSWPTCFQLPMLGPRCWPRSPGRSRRAGAARRSAGAGLGRQCGLVRGRARMGQLGDGRLCGPRRRHRGRERRMRRRRFGSPASRARAPPPTRPSAPARRSASRPARWCRRALTPSCGSRTRPLRTARFRSSVEVEPGRDIRRAGEDIRTGDEVLRAGAVLGSAELGVLASIGIAEPECARRPTGGDRLDRRRASGPVGADALRRRPQLERLHRARARAARGGGGRERRALPGRSGGDARRSRAGDASRRCGLLRRRLGRRPRSRQGGVRRGGRGGALLGRGAPARQADLVRTSRRAASRSGCRATRSRPS